MSAVEGDGKGMGILSMAAVTKKEWEITFQVWLTDFELGS